ncbi:Diphthine--ammonia ligase [Nakaseomyces glabratus]|uniref:Diphthine--ammonia ligase n=1 Tax=Candida glabrata TaxID=5478 RepID=A0A0W0D7Y1_CANGB|nr:Diphthine--ammonia ligase [Nakaseomyces glabratus]KTB06473.1 Diphthine--ammonia ligase [Nakaseomyces glabratus]KTB07932.1 Diphthine--ammonia ligase [Nakaseomyces glabratus]KTB15098.1 Diphthine--ammonia ligase [Nakaseomyces glabratus]
MKFVALISGGKDSCYNILHCQRQGHELVALANLRPIDTDKQELDSFMFQTVGHDIVSLYENCTGLPLFRKEIHPKTSKNVELNYTPTKDDEIEVLYQLLSEVKQSIPDLQAVSVGAILSSYQRTRVEDVCGRLGLVVLSYLWQRSQLELMTEMCSMSKQEDELNSSESCKLDARIIKVAAIGLDSTDLGKSLPQLFPKMLKLNTQYEVHICGEGGEFESMVLDAPFFRKGFLKLEEVIDTTDSENDGVYNAQLKVKFQKRELPDDIFQSELSRLPVPPLFDPAWNELYELIDNENFEDTKTINTMNIRLPSVKTHTNRIGNLLYISNIQPQYKDGTVQEQVKDVLQQLDNILKDNHLTAKNVLYSSLLLKDMSLFASVNQEYSKFFDIWKNGPLPPARACIESNIINDGSALQLSVVVKYADQTLGNDIEKCEKSGLHVQGRSYWAPCNIGPYSQSIWLSNDLNQLSYLSGQIALEPSQMEMIDTNDAKQQAVLSLKHLDSIKQVINARNQVQLTCFISNNSIVPLLTQTWAQYSEDIIYSSEMEEWCGKPSESQDCLIIVKVSNLPRNALCEWGGIAAKSLEVEHDDHDLTAELRKLNLDGGINIINHHDLTLRRFKTIFANTAEQLITQIRGVTFKNTHFIIFFSEYLCVDELQDTSAEFIPVEKVYNYKGEEVKFAAHIVNHTKF